MDPAPGTFTIATPLDRSGPVAIIQVRTSDPGPILSACQAPDLDVGQLRLAPLWGVDRGLVARITPRTLQIMPHGGLEIVRRIVESIEALGLRHEPAPDVRTLYPEAADLIEARTLQALARAASPRAVELLLEQPSRWRRPGAASDPSLDRQRSRLIEPPVVVAWGATNIGKSTLLNALAGRRVAIVADEPGTTRDHVGAMLEVDGLVVRYVDAPGLRPDPNEEERRAVDLAMDLAHRADLLLLCGDATRPAPPAPAPADVLRVALRRDLGPPGFTADIETTAPAGVGLADLSRAIRSALVPDQALTDPSPWRFWSDDGAD